MRTVIPLLCLVIVGCVNAEIKDRGWWKNTVFYQIFTRSFLDQSAEGDGNGDLKGIKYAIENNYFTDLGIGGLILTPIYDSPGYNVGHDVSDHMDIHADFGTLKDFEDLVEAAHNKSIKIVLDFVPNHTSKKHHWFTKSQNCKGVYKDFYIWQDPKDANKKTPPSNWLSVFSQSAWNGESIGTGDVKTPKFYLHQFSSEEADLNYDNKVVQIEMINILRFWMDEKVDGFRVNAIDHIYEKNFTTDEEKIGAHATKYDDLKHTLTKDDPRNYDLLKTWREFLDQHSNSMNYSEKVLITEANTNRDNNLKYFDFGSNIPLNFDLITSVNSVSKAKEFQDVINDWISKSANYTPNWTLGNHDKSRLATRFPDRSDQMTMLVMVLPGIVVTYYGEEIGMEDGKVSRAVNNETKYVEEKKEINKRDVYRTPFQWTGADNAGFTSGKKPWLGINENFKAINVESEKKDPKSHYNIYRELIKLRNSPILKNGTTTVEVLNNEKDGEVLSIVRKLNEESVVLLINFSAEQNKTVTVNVAKYAPGAEVATVNISSSTFLQANWSSNVPIDKVVLPPKASVILIMKNGAGLLMASINLLAITLFILFKLN